MSKKLSGYELSRQWFDFAFESPDLVSASHTALYLFLCEIHNRIGRPDKFQITANECMSGMSCKSYNTYKKCLDNLIEWNFVELVRKSSNQYQCNIIALSKFDTSLYKALDKAQYKAFDKPLDKAPDKPLETFINPKPKNPKPKNISSSEKSEVDTTSFLNSYNKFLKHRTGVEEQFSIAGRTALKKIRAYFRTMVEKKHPGATPEVIESETLKSFEWVLSNFEKWDNFHQKQLKLEQINSNLINIISSIKNGNTKQNNGYGSKQRFDAAGVAAEAHAILKTKFRQPGEATEHTPEGGPADHDSEGGFADYEVLQ